MGGGRGIRVGSDKKTGPRWWIIREWGVGLGLRKNRYIPIGDIA